MFGDGCEKCDYSGVVCENHASKPWDGHSNREDACGCGAGMACQSCSPVVVKSPISDLITSLDIAISKFEEPMSMLNGHELGERLASDIREAINSFNGSKS